MALVTAGAVALFGYGKDTLMKLWEKQTEFKDQLRFLQMFFDFTYKNIHIDTRHPMYCTLNDLKKQYDKLIKMDKYLWVKRADNLKCIWGYEKIGDKYRIKVLEQDFYDRLHAIKDQIKVEKNPMIWSVNTEKVEELEKELETFAAINAQTDKGWLTLEPNQVYLGAYPPLYKPPCNTFIGSKSIFKNLPMSWYKWAKEMTKNQTGKLAALKKFTLQSQGQVAILAETLHSLSDAYALQAAIELASGLPVVNGVALPATPIDKPQYKQYTLKH